MLGMYQIKGKHAQVGSINGVKIFKDMIKIKIGNREISVSKDDDRITYMGENPADTFSLCRIDLEALSVGGVIVQSKYGDSIFEGTLSALSSCGAIKKSQVIKLDLPMYVEKRNSCDR